MMFKFSYAENAYRPKSETLHGCCWPGYIVGNYHV